MAHRRKESVLLNACPTQHARKDGGNAKNASAESQRQSGPPDPSQEFDHVSGSRGAFTLIEVLLVVAILGVIAAAVVPALIGRQQDANMQITKTDIKGLEQAMKMYAIDHDGEYLQGSKDALSATHAVVRIPRQEDQAVPGRDSQGRLGRALELRIPLEQGGREAGHLVLGPQPPERGGGRR